MSQTSGIFISDSSGFSNVPKPSAGHLSYFLNINDGNALYAMKSDGSVFPIITQTMKVAQTVLTSTQLSTLVATPVTVLPAPRSGWMNVIHSVTEDYKFNELVDLPYGGGGTTLNYTVGNHDNPGTFLVFNLETDSNILGGSRSIVRSCIFATGLNQTGAPFVIGDAFIVRNPSGFEMTGGTASLTVRVAYQSVRIDS